MSSLQTYKGYLTGSYSGSQKSEVCPMPYALCPMPYAQSYLIFLRKAISKFTTQNKNSFVFCFLIVILNYLFSLVDFLGTIWL